MKIIYARQSYEKPASGIFLAGPTPRDRHVATWRPRTLHILEHELHYDGTVFVPEDEGFGPMAADLEQAVQIDWERSGLRDSTVVVVWCPRVLENMEMPALTTNIEFGAISGLFPIPTIPYVLGYPHGTRKMGYLKHVAGQQNMPILATLENTLAAAVEMATRPPRSLYAPIVQSGILTL